MEDYHQVSTLLIRYAFTDINSTAILGGSSIDIVFRFAQSIEKWKSRMMVQCVICCGLIQMVRNILSNSKQ
jgi:hypothetical protein